MVAFHITAVNPPLDARLERPRMATRVPSMGCVLTPRVGASKRPTLPLWVVDASDRPAFVTGLA